MSTLASTRDAPRDVADLPAVLRVEDVAALLRVDPSTVYRLTRAGTIPHRRLGRVLRFDRDQIARWLGGEDGERDGHAGD